VNTDTALDLLRGIADGRVALKDAALLDDVDLDAVARVGAAALEGKRFDVARTVFRGLAAIDPRNAQHLLHLGAVEHAAGNVDDAIDALTRFLDADLARDAGDVARALLLRAELFGARDKIAARNDLAAAHELARTSTAARAVVEGEAR
jgi:tetratricopeptide (TPR) repeat protein